MIDNEECNLNVVNINSLRINRINVCCHCGQRLDRPNCEVSSRDEFNIYYIRCTCHFVNKIKDSKVLVAPLSEKELVRALFEANGCRFNSYYTSEDDIHRPFDCKK